MDKKIFYIRRSNKGLGAILSSRHPRTVIVYAQSPYATRKQNRCWRESCWQFTNDIITEY